MTELTVTTPLTFSVRAVPTNPVPLTPGKPTVILVPQPGGPGPTGPAGDGTQVFGETPTGARNGTNTVFATANPYRPNTVALFVNGIRERRTVGYNETSPTTITLTAAPGVGDDVMIDYLVQ